MAGRVRLSLLAAALIAFAAPFTARAQEVRETFVRLGNGVPGVFYEPAGGGPKAGIGVFVMHMSNDYLTFSACTELSKRGYSVLCANNSSSKSGNETELNIDRAMLDAKLGVTWLRKRAGIRKVILFGHSGGGVLMSSYQAIAEGGLAACQGPEKILKCPDALKDLPAGDGLMLVDSNYGMSMMTLFSLDPAIIDETSGRKLDPKLDLYNPANGFAPTGATYGPDFAKRFQSAIGRRENQLIAAAQARLKAIEAGAGRYDDDEPFIVPGANYTGANNKFFSEDPRFLSRTQKARPLLHKDGTVTTEIVHTVRRPESLKPTTGRMDASLRTTVRRFLTNTAVRTGPDFSYDESGIHGVDWASSYTTPQASVTHVKVPLLTMGMTGHWEFLAAEGIYENAASADKTIAFVEGANHVYTTCKQCETTPGQYGDTVKTTYDYVDAWLSKPGRF